MVGASRLVSQGRPGALLDVAATDLLARSPSGAASALSLIGGFIRSGPTPFQVASEDRQAGVALAE